MQKTDAETLFTMIKSALLALGLDIKNLRGQAYDGAVNMA